MTDYEIIKEVNYAFLRLESYMMGKKQNYEYYGFTLAFIILFDTLKKEENINIENYRLIGEYWKLIERLCKDYDDADFENFDAFSNKSFSLDFEELMYLKNSKAGEFKEFDISLKDEKKISIQDIVKTESIIVERNETNPYPRIFSSHISYQLFTSLHNEFKNDNRFKTANYSFIYYSMLKDQLVVCGGTEFIGFLSNEFEIELDRISSRQQYSRNTNRKILYETLKNSI